MNTMILRLCSALYARPSAKGPIGETVRQPHMKPSWRLVFPFATSWLILLLIAACELDSSMSVCVVLFGQKAFGPKKLVGP